jgi:hypothetical protein
MKQKLFAVGMVAALCVSAHATLWTFSGTPTDNGAGPGVIPDNTSIGLGESLTVSSEASSLTALTLTFILQGGFSSDLSGYLRLGNSSSSPFFDLTTLIQSQTLSQTAGTTYTIDFNTSGFSTAFNGFNPNDTWTLFFEDNSPLGQTTLNGWSLDINPVPEPVNVALVIFGVSFVGLGALRIYRKSGKATLPSPSSSIT